MIPANDTSETTVFVDGGDSSLQNFSETVPLFSHLAAGMARRTRWRHLSCRVGWHPSDPLSDATIIGSSGILDAVAADPPPRPHCLRKPQSLDHHR